MASIVYYTFEIFLYELLIEWIISLSDEGVSALFWNCFFLNLFLDILVNMLKKEKKRVKDASLQLERLGQRPPSSARGEGFSER